METADQADFTRVSLALPHSLSLNDAIALGASIKEPVLAYAFDNGPVSGEFAPATGSSEEFLRFFLEDYGTSPQITALVVWREVADAESTSTPRIVATDLGADLPEYTAPPVEFGGTIQARHIASEEATRAPKDSAAVLALDWRPDDTNHSIFPSSGKALFGQQFSWMDGGLYMLPNQVGLEFEITEYNNSVATPSNVRPLCFDTSYKDRFWASNHSYSWAVTDWFWTTGSLSPSPYADYNDATDLCAQNSIAIGLRYPKNLTRTGGSYDIITVDILILAPFGLQSTSPISGNVQAISAEYCNSWPGSSMSLTDCMGVADITSYWAGSPTGVYNRGTLNVSRGWSAPWRCWSTADKGASLTALSCY